MHVSDRTLDALLVIAVQDLVDAEVETARTLETSDTEISGRAQRRIRKRMKQYARELWWADVPSGYRRAVATVLVVCTVFLGMCMSIPEVRAELASTVLKWYDKFVSVFYIADETAPEYIEEYKEPMLQIAGTERVVIEQVSRLYKVAYQNETGVVVSYYQMVLAEEPVDVDGENQCVQTEISVNDYAGKLFEYDNGEKIITWQDGQYSFLVDAYISSIDLSVMISMAESVQ